MKLRIRENTIRVRLSQSEVDDLGRKGMVNSETHFPGNTVMTFVISKADKVGITCVFENSGIYIGVPETILNDWVKTDKVGFEADLDLENGSKFSILVEKDFQCLTKRPDEDESDMYPNPLQSH